MLCFPGLTPVEKDDQATGEITAEPRSILASRSVPGVHWSFMSGHVRNFLDCIGTRRLTVSHPELAQRAHTIAHCANISLRLGRKVHWDPNRERFVDDSQANRMLVTSHPTFGYLSDRYGLEQLGAVYPVSPSSEPSAQDIALLEDAIREFGVPAVFTESTINPKLAAQVAADTGVELVPLYTGSLGAEGSGAETYILLMRYDVSAIVEALK